MSETPPSSDAARLGENLLGRLGRTGKGGKRFSLPNFGRGIFGHYLGLKLTSPYQVALLAGLSGLSGAGVLVVLTSSLQGGEDGSPALGYGLTFVALILVYRWLQLTLLRTTTEAVESALDSMRSRNVEKIVQLDLYEFEDIPNEQLQSKMVRHFEVISESTVGILGGLQSTILLTLVLIYLATVSLVAAVMSITVLGIAVQAYFLSRTKMQSQMQAAAEAETSLLGSLHSVMYGFKELRLDSTKRSEVVRELQGHSSVAATQRTLTQGLFGRLMVFSNTLAFLLGGAVVFVVPALLDADYHEDVARVVTIVLFLIGPLSAVVAASQHVSTARFAINSLLTFEAELDALLSTREVAAANAPAFESLSFDDVSFEHRAHGTEMPFAVGPIDFHAKSGEIIFITGGNGSGKTTFLRLLTGLYPAAQGTLSLNGAELEPTQEALESYRHVFNAVFADVFVFRKPYGMNADQLDRLAGWLQILKIRDKLPENLSDGYDAGFLSTGQRKRLALAIALAEDRDVLVLDEWAADQDPEFRSFFYDILLPEMGQKGKTIIAVTHDDRFFGLADRRYHMDEGRIREIRDETS